MGQTLLEREDVLEEALDWEAGLQELHGRIAHRFSRSESRQRVLAYLQGLLGSVERKNGWQLAEYAGDATPDGVQRLLAVYQWDADEVRDDLRGYVVEHLGDAGGVLVVDETGFLKKGRRSVGVKRQYSGTAGKVENCQIGVFLAYGSRHGAAFLDRELYLPQEWAADGARRREAGVPQDVVFHTKAQLAQQMITRAVAAGVPFAWVTGDTVYGNDRKLRRWLEEQGRPYVLAVKSNEPLWADREGGAAQVAACELAQQIPDDRWQPLRGCLKRLELGWRYPGVIRGLVVTWGYETISLSQRPQRPRMATAGTIAATAQTGRPTDHLPSSGDRQRHPLRAAHWVLLADAAPRPATVAHCLPLLPDLAS